MRGLVLGKFLPYHAGHAHLIREARRQVDELVVLVCSVEREPIPGGLRDQWVRQAHPDCRVIHVAEEVPQAPSESPDFWPIWTDLIARHAGHVDRVFTSESYGDELARCLHATHVSVDPERRAFPISGTDLRADPMRHWEFLPRMVRPYFVRRVALVGPESSGKTTLAAALAAHFSTTWVPEYGREYCESRDARDLVHEDFEAIVWGQATLEDTLAAEANRVLICDTELHTTCTWSDLILGECREWLRRVASARPYAGLLLLGHDMPWINDGTRVLELRRVEHTHRIEEEFRQAGRTWITIEGSPAARLSAAIGAVERILAEPVRLDTVAWARHSSPA
jgi:NadR type nicotinamide-nucleotide adenylyltransferase